MSALLRKAVTDPGTLTIDEISEIVRETSDPALGDVLIGRRATLATKAAPATPTTPERAPLGMSSAALRELVEYAVRGSLSKLVARVEHVEHVTAALDTRIAHVTKSAERPRIPAELASSMARLHKAGFAADKLVEDLHKQGAAPAHIVGTCAAAVIALDDARPKPRPVRVA